MFGGLEFWILRNSASGSGCTSHNHRLGDADVSNEFTCKESTLLIYYELEFLFRQIAYHDVC